MMSSSGAVNGLVVLVCAILVTATPVSSRRACIAVAIDLSDTIDDVAHQYQESDALTALWNELSYAARLMNYYVDVILMPFNHDVLTTLVKRLKSDTYSTPDAFIAAEKQKWNDIVNHVRTTETGGLTDFTAVFKYVKETACVGDIKALIIISDFIISQELAAVDDTLKALTDDGYKIVAMGLDKERNEVTFREMGDLSGYSVDMADDDWSLRLGWDVIDEIIPLA